MRRVSIILPGSLLIFAPGCWEGKGSLGVAPPSEPEVDIGPTDPRTDDELLAVIVTPSRGSGDEVSYTYAWRQDGIPRPDLTTDRVPAAETTKGEVWAVTVTPVEAGLAGAPATASTTIRNSPPVAGVVVAPTAPTTEDDLTATPSAVDADGDAVTFALSWTVDYAPLDEVSDTISADRTEHGQVWTVTVLPSDAEGEGEPATETVVIANSAPVMLAAAIVPEAPFVNEDLVAVVESADADGDTVGYRYTWFVDGEEVQSGEDDTLAAGSFSKHQRVSVEVVPLDGFDEGVGLVSADAVVQNSVPVGGAVTIDPAVAVEASLLTCLPTGFADADADAEGWTFAWTVGGAVVGSTATLDGAAFNKADVVTCTASPWDGEVAGASSAATVTIANTAPVLAGVSLSTLLPTEADTLSVTLGAATDDDGDAVSFAYAWYVNGSLAGTEATLSGSAFAKGDSIYVVVTPGDGSDEGAPVTSDVATGTNTPPVVTSVTLSPGAVYTADTLTASVTGSDVDGDAVSYAYAWYVDGVLLGSETASSLDGATAFDKDQAVVVVVTPSDAEGDGVALASGEVTVLNSPPTAPVIALSPSDAMEGDSLTCTVATEGTDADGDTLTYAFDWDVDGAVYTGATDDLLDSLVDGAVVGEGELWACTVTASDGTSASAAVTEEVEVLSAEPAWSLVASWPLTSKPSGAYAANGAYGGQSVGSYGGSSCWNQTSDWNYLWIPHPDASARRMRIEVDVYANTSSTWGFSVMPLVDGPFYIPDTYTRNGVGFGTMSAYYILSYTGTTAVTFATSLQTAYTWFTVRQDVDFDAGTTTVYKDGVVVGTGAISPSAAVGSKILLNSGVPFSGSHCFKNLNFYTAP